MIFFHKTAAFTFSGFGETGFGEMGGHRSYGITGPTVEHSFKTHLFRQYYCLKRYSFILYTGLWEGLLVICGAIRARKSHLK